MEGERLTERGDALRVEGRRNRGRPRLMGGPWEERFGGNGRGESEGWRDGGMEMVVGDVSETRGKIKIEYRCQPHPGLPG